jgi:glycosyltransferase involved in cell wall biosynthesis
MRLAYLTPQYPKVSHTFIRREIHALEKRGHAVLRISIRKPAASMTVDPADEAERERTIFCLAAGPQALLAAVARALVRAPGASLASLAEVLRMGLGPERGVLAKLAYWVEACFVLSVLRRERIEHLHVHFGTNAATVALLVRRLGGPPFSMTVHGPDEIDAPRSHALREKVEASSFTVGISHYTVAQLRRWARTEDWPKLHVVRCSVDEAFFREAVPVEPASQTLLCIGRLCPQKGQVLLVAAFAALLREHPGARLVLAGDGEMRPEVEAAIRRFGVEDAVEITGWIDEAQVRGRLRACRALVLASFAEGLPVVLMEALAMHRPVISTFVAGIPELVRPGENGWLVPASDADALTEAMGRALRLPGAALAEMGARGAERVRELHDPASAAARLERLIQGEP